MMRRRMHHSYWTAATHCPLSLQGLHPVHLCAKQNRSDLHRGAWHHLQGAALCPHLGPPPLELRWPAGEDVGLSKACAHVRLALYNHHKVVWAEGGELKGYRAWSESLLLYGDLLFIRSYTKPKGQLPDYTSPVVLPDGRTSVEDFCLKIHKNLIKELK